MPNNVAHFPPVASASNNLTKNEIDVSPVTAAVGVDCVC